MIYDYFKSQLSHDEGKDLFQPRMKSLIETFCLENYFHWMITFCIRNHNFIFRCSLIC